MIKVITALLYLCFSFFLLKMRRNSLMGKSPAGVFVVDFLSLLDPCVRAESLHFFLSPLSVAPHSYTMGMVMGSTLIMVLLWCIMLGVPLPLPYVSIFFAWVVYMKCKFTTSPGASYLTELLKNRYDSRKSCDCAGVMFIFRSQNVNVFVVLVKNTSPKLELRWFSSCTFMIFHSHSLCHQWPGAEADTSFCASPPQDCREQQSDLSASFSPMLDNPSVLSPSSQDIPSMFLYQLHCLPSSGHILCPEFGMASISQ